MKIAIVGAGAIGAWLGARLARAGFVVSVLARGATLAAVRSSGLQLLAGEESIASSVVASDRAGDLGEQDLVILAVKSTALESVAPSFAALIGPNTAVLSAMNGIAWWFFHGLPGALADASLRSVDPHGLLKASIPPKRVIGCVVHASCTTVAPGCSRHKAGNGLIVGEPSGETSPRLQATVAALRSAAFDVTVSARIQQDIWYKLWGNMTMNPVSALTGVTCDLILDEPLVRSYVLRIMAEAAAIGARIGCPIEQSGEERIQVTRKLGAFKTSMLQDVEAGRALELDALLAAPREIGRAVGTETPNMDALHGLTRLLAAAHGLNPS